MLKQEEQYQITWVILKTINNLEGGKGKIASFLRSSHSKLVQEQGLDKRIGYGALLWHDISTITGFINQLEEMELIKTHLVRTFHFSYPVLILTEAGKKALKEKIKIPLQLRKETKTTTLNETQLTTLKLLNGGKSVSEISEERKLKEATVYKHFQRLIAHGKLNVKECISKENIKLILETLIKFPKQVTLTELKEVLPENITFEEIRCVLEDRTLQNER